MNSFIVRLKQGQPVNIFTSCSIFDQTFVTTLSHPTNSVFLLQKYYLIVNCSYLKYLLCPSQFPLCPFKFVYSHLSIIIECSFVILFPCSVFLFIPLTNTFLSLVFTTLVTFISSILTIECYHSSILLFPSIFVLTLCLCSQYHPFKLKFIYMNYRFCLCSLTHFSLSLFTAFHIYFTEIKVKN